MKVSVVVPVYNAATYLEQCLDSILAQTFTDFELLLVDDCSTDDSGQICDRYASNSQVRVVHLTERLGVSTARNIGVKNARGDLIAFIDSDILPIINKIASFYEITIHDNYIEKLKNNMINILKLEYIKYFYKDIFFNSIQKYFINKFDKAYIKKIMDEEYIKDTEYDIECINKIIKDSIKTFEYILKNKREISFNIPDIYLKNLNYSNIKSNIISIVTNLFIIYEIEYKLINEDLISFASKITQFIGENLLSGMGSSGNILIENIVNYFQKQFEYAYISSIIGEDSSVIEYDFNYIKRFI